MMPTARSSSINSTLLNISAKRWTKYAVGENKQLRSEGDDRLVGTKYDWLRHPGHFAGDAWKKFKSLRESTLKTARAWALKETAMTLFSYSYTGAARSFFKRWHGWASR